MTYNVKKSHNSLYFFIFDKYMKENSFLKLIKYKQELVFLFLPNKNYCIDKFFLSHFFNHTNTFGSFFNSNLSQ